MTIQALGVTELAASAGQTSGPLLEATIAPEGFPALQLGHGALHTNAEQSRTCPVDQRHDFFWPLPLLPEMVKDRMGPLLELLSPAPMETRQQLAALLIQHKLDAGLAVVLGHRRTFIQMIPARASILRFARDEMGSHPHPPGSILVDVSLDA